MGQMFDSGLNAARLGYVFQRGGPAAVRRTLVDQPNGSSVGRRRHRILNAVVLGIHESRTIGVDVPDEGALRLAMQDQFAQVATRLDDVGRYAKHVDVL